MIQNQKVLVMKIGIFGDSQVGKTSLIKKYLTGDNFQNVQLKQSSGIYLYTKDISINDHQCHLLIYDTAGENQLKSIKNLNLRNLACGIFVFDAASQKSFEQVQLRYQQFKQYAPQYSIGILVSNKLDLLNLQIAENTGKKYAQSNQMHYVSTSALTGQNVEKLFQESVQLIFDLILERKVNIFDQKNGIQVWDKSKCINQNGPIQIESFAKENQSICKIM